MVLGGDMRDARHRQDVCPKIARMPQGLGKTSYHTLSVYENVDFFARLFGRKAERENRIDELLRAPDWILSRSPCREIIRRDEAKLGLCCALIHDPRC